MGIWSATSTPPARRCSASAGTGRSSCSSRARRTSRSCCCRSRSRCRRSASTSWSRRCSGAGSCSASTVPIEHPVAVRARRAGDGRLDRRARLPARGGVRALPTAWALGNLFEYPVWLVCGFLVPLSLFPTGCGRSRGCSRRPGALTRSASRRSAASRWPDCSLCLGLGLAYLAPAPARGDASCARPRAAGARSRCVSVPTGLLRRRADQLPRALQLPVALRSSSRRCSSRRSSRSCSSRTSAARRRRVGRVLRDRQRAPVRARSRASSR